MPLKEIHKHLSQIVQTTQVGIISLDTNGCVTTWNEGAQNITGYALHDVLGKHFSTFAPSEGDFVQEEQRFRLCLQEGHVPPYEVCSLHKSGARLVTVMNLSRLHDESGNIIGVSAVFRDITAKKRLEEIFINKYKELEEANQSLLKHQEELKRTNDCFQFFYDNAPDMLATIDLNSGQVLDCNTTFCKILGCLLEGMIGKNIYHLHHPESYSTLYHILSQLKKAGTIQNKKLFLLRDDRTKISVSLSANAALYNNLQMIGIFCWRDIRSLKDYEEKLQELRTARKELEEKNIELNDFVYTVSHDLRSPLRVINNMTSWLLEDFSNLLPPRAKRYLHIIEERIQKLAKMLDDLLLYARADTTQELFEEININAIIAEIQKEIVAPPTLSFSVQPNFPPLLGARIALEQVLRNIIFNTIKHHHNLSEAKISIYFKERKKYLEIFIQDNGPGIPKKYHSKIFNIFETLGKPLENKGSGVGLSIVKKLTQQNGGKILVSCVPQGGTLFRILWPYGSPSLHGSSSAPYKKSSTD